MKSSLQRNYLTPTVIFLAICFVAAFFLRFYLIPQNLFFGYEQGRDFLAIADIVQHHKLTLIGSKTDIEGVFHGPIFYYIAAIPFVLSRGNPVAVEGFLILLQSLTVFTIYFLGRELFNKRTGLIAATLFTVSFASVAYSRWLSNPPLSIPLVALFLLFLVKFLKGDKRSIFWAAICLGVLAQVQFLNMLFFFPIVFIALIVYRKTFFKTNPLYLLVSLIIAGVIAFGTYFLFDMRHSFLITKSILALLSGHSGYYSSYGDTFMLVMSTLFASAASVITPFYSVAAALLLVAGLAVNVIHTQKNKNSLIVPITIIVPLLVLILLHHTVLIHYFIPLFVPVIVLTAFLLEFIWQKNKILGAVCLAALIILNLYTWMVNIPKNSNTYFQSTQPEFHYSDQLKAIDIVYQNSNGQPFAYQVYTIPYWSGQGWQYLFDYYGKKKYGYTQVPQEKAKVLFVIIQNDKNNLLYQQLWLRDTVSKWGTESARFHLGDLTIQKRLLY